MITNYNEKIEKIKNDRVLMLTSIKDKVANNSQALIANLDTVIEKLDNDEINTKKYKAIIKAKQLILELIEQIISANSIEEIVKLRKMVNYYINKIKKELEERQIDEEDTKNIYNNVEHLRLDIRRYIRYLKREDNIIRIDGLYQNFDNLSPDEIAELKKLLANEMRYNRKFNNAIDTYPPKKHKTGVEASCEITTDVIINSILGFCGAIVEDSNNSAIINNNSASYSFLGERIQHYLGAYKFPDSIPYDGSFRSRILAFLNNIKNYSKNKKIMSYVERDYYTYYHGGDLACFMAYFTKSNSIGFGLQLLLNNSKLSQREIECLLNHEMCLEWILEFCISKDIDDIPNEQELSSARKILKLIQKQYRI